MKLTFPLLALLVLAPLHLRAQTLVYTFHHKPSTADVEKVTYSANAQFPQFALAPTGECAVVLGGSTTKGSAVTDILWLSANGKQSATVRLPQNTIVLGILNVGASSLCVALQSGQKQLVQTFTRKASRLLRTATLEHGGSLDNIDRVPTLPGINATTVLAPDLGNGFIGLRVDGSGGLRITRYKY